MYMKTIRIRPLAVAAAASVLLLAGVCAGGIGTAVRTANAARELPIYSVGRDDNKVAISFDAAWGNEDTAHLIEILDEYNVKTTFFVVGSWVDKYPESVKQLMDAGHEIMNHSNTHPHLTSLTSEGVIAEASQCADKIEAITGVRPNLLRPPYGDYNNTVITALRGIGIYTIQWSVDSLDWKELSAAEITSRVLGSVKSGSIVLFHNAAKHTPEALPGILSGLQKKGYEIVPVSQLIYYENYTIDHTGMQICDPAEESGNKNSSGGQE